MRVKIASGVRRALLAADPNGLMVKGYRAARAAPLVRYLWRRFDPQAAMLDPARYAAKGGVFQAETSLTAPLHSPPPELDNDGFFSELVARIAASQPSYLPIAGRAVLVNNGLSAGGAERQIVYTLRGLARRGWDARFVGEYLGVARGHDFHLPTLRAAGIDARSLSPVSRPMSQLYATVPRAVAECLARFPPQTTLEILAMVDELRAARPEVIHLWQDETSIKHGLAALLAGAPRIVLSGRNLDPTHFAYHRPYMRAGYRALADRPQVVLSNNSHAGAASYEAWLGLEAGRIRVVTNGVDPAAWPKRDPGELQSWRLRHGIALHAPLVVGVLRLSEEKRPLLWLDVAARARDEEPDLRFVLVGDGPLRTEVENRIDALGLRGAVICIREAADVSLPIAASNALMLTSAQEGLPNVLIEAQWYGLPCLATDAGGAAEALVDGVTGVLARSDRPEDLARVLLDLIGDGALARSAQIQGPRVVAQKFGVKRMLDETERLYRPS